MDSDRSNECWTDMEEDTASTMAEGESCDSDSTHHHESKALDKNLKQHSNITNRLEDLTEWDNNRIIEGVGDVLRCSGVENNNKEKFDGLDQQNVLFINDNNQVNNNELSKNEINKNYIEFATTKYGYDVSSMTQQDLTRSQHIDSNFEIEPNLLEEISEFISDTLNKVNKTQGILSDDKPKGFHPFSGGVKRNYENYCGNSRSQPVLRTQSKKVLRFKSETEVFIIPSYDDDDYNNDGPQQTRPSSPCSESKYLDREEGLTLKRKKLTECDTDTIDEFDEIDSIPVEKESIVCESLKNSIEAIVETEIVDKFYEVLASYDDRNFVNSNAPSECEDLEYQGEILSTKSIPKYRDNTNEVLTDNIEKYSNLTSTIGNFIDSELLPEAATAAVDTKGKEILEPKSEAQQTATAIFDYVFQLATEDKKEIEIQSAYEIISESNENSIPSLNQEIQTNIESSKIQTESIISLDHEEDVINRGGYTYISNDFIIGEDKGSTGTGTDGSDDDLPTVVEVLDNDDSTDTENSEDQFTTTLEHGIPIYREEIFVEDESLASLITNQVCMKDSKIVEYISSDTSSVIQQNSECELPEFDGIEARETAELTSYLPKTTEMKSGIGLDILKLVEAAEAGNVLKLSTISRANIFGPNLNGNLQQNKSVFDSDISASTENSTSLEPSQNDDLNCNEGIKIDFNKLEEDGNDKGEICDENHINFEELKIETEIKELEVDLPTSKTLSSMCLEQLAMKEDAPLLTQQIAHVMTSELEFEEMSEEIENLNYEECKVIVSEVPDEILNFSNSVDNIETVVLFSGEASVQISEVYEDRVANVSNEIKFEIGTELDESEAKNNIDNLNQISNLYTDEKNSTSSTNEEKLQSVKLKSWSDVSSSDNEDVENNTADITIDSFTLSHNLKSEPIDNTLCDNVNNPLIFSEVDGENIISIENSKVRPQSSSRILLYPNNYCFEEEDSRFKFQPNSDFSLNNQTTSWPDQYFTEDPKIQGESNDDKSLNVECKYEVNDRLVKLNDDPQYGTYSENCLVEISELAVNRTGTEIKHLSLEEILNQENVITDGTLINKTETLDNRSLEILVSTPDIDGITQLLNTNNSNSSTPSYLEDSVPEVENTEDKHEKLDYEGVEGNESESDAFSGTEEEFELDMEEELHTEISSTEFYLSDKGTTTMDDTVDPNEDGSLLMKHFIGDTPEINSNYENEVASYKSPIYHMNWASNIEEDLSLERPVHSNISLDVQVGDHGENSFKDYEVEKENVSQIPNIQEANANTVEVMECEDNFCRRVNSADKFHSIDAGMYYSRLQNCLDHPELAAEIDEEGDDDNSEISNLTAFDLGLTVTPIKFEGESDEDDVELCFDPEDITTILDDDQLFSNSNLSKMSDTSFYQMYELTVANDGKLDDGQFTPRLYHKRQEDWSNLELVQNISRSESAASIDDEVDLDQLTGDDKNKYCLYGSRDIYLKKERIWEDEIFVENNISEGDLEESKLHFIPKEEEELLIDEALDEVLVEALEEVLEEARAKVKNTDLVENLEIVKGKEVIMGDIEESNKERAWQNVKNEVNEELKPEIRAALDTMEETLEQNTEKEVMEESNLENISIRSQKNTEKSEFEDNPTIKGNTRTVYFPLDEFGMEYFTKEVPEVCVPKHKHFTFKYYTKKDLANLSPPNTPYTSRSLIPTQLWSNIQIGDGKIHLGVKSLSNARLNRQKRRTGSEKNEISHVQSDIVIKKRKTHYNSYSSLFETEDQQVKPSPNKITCGVKSRKIIKTSKNKIFENLYTTRVPPFNPEINIKPENFKTPVYPFDYKGHMYEICGPVSYRKNYLNLVDNNINSLTHLSPPRTPPETFAEGKGQIENNKSPEKISIWKFWKYLFNKKNKVAIEPLSIENNKIIIGEETLVDKSSISETKMTSNDDWFKD